MTKLLVFHPTIAPYRIDFFNDLYAAFHTHVCLKFWNLRDQTFDYQKIYSRFTFRPIYLKEMFKLGQRSFSKGYWTQLDRYKPEVVMTDEFGWSTMWVLLHRWVKRKKYKVVVLCDDSYDMVSQQNDHSWIHRWARRWIAPKVDEIIVVEPRVEEWYRIHYQKGFFFPIIQKDMVVRDLYMEAWGGSSMLRSKHRLNGKRVFLFVGRLVALKNVKTILRAFAHLNPQENRLVIVGDGPEMVSLKSLARNLNIDVLFTGRLEGNALYAWYLLADVFVLASYREAFGAVTNEALLAGCYALVSQNAGSSCLIQEGVNGYTFSPMDVEELAQRMRDVLRLPKVRAVNGLKENQMKISYQECIHRLIIHLKQLSHE